MNGTTVTNEVPELSTCRVCGHPGTHPPPAVTFLGGVKYCSSCPECRAELDQIANMTYAMPERLLPAAAGNAVGRDA